MVVDVNELKKEVEKAEKLVEARTAEYDAAANELGDRVFAIIEPYINAVSVSYSVSRLNAVDELVYDCGLVYDSSKAGVNNVAISFRHKKLQIKFYDLDITEKCTFCTQLFLDMANLSQHIAEIQTAINAVDLTNYKTVRESYRDSYANLDKYKFDAKEAQIQSIFSNVKEESFYIANPDKGFRIFFDLIPIDELHYIKILKVTKQYVYIEIVAGNHTTVKIEEQVKKEEFAELIEHGYISHAENVEEEE